MAAIAVGFSKSSNFSTTRYRDSMWMSNWRDFRCVVTSKLAVSGFVVDDDSEPTTSMSMILRGAVTLPH